MLVRWPQPLFPMIFQVSIVEVLGISIVYTSVMIISTQIICLIVS